jgi:hypothetical protein
MQGSLLGDGTLWKIRNEYQVSYFSMTNAVEDYAAWMFGELSNLCTRPVLRRERARLGTKTISFEVNTASHPVFRDWRKKWYPLGKKIVPGDVQEWLSPIAAAVWFMEDGYRFGDTAHQMKGYRKLYIGRTISFSTDAYQSTDIKKLLLALETNFGIHPYYLENNRHIRLHRDDSKKLVEIMSPYIQDSYKYKIAIDQPDRVLDETEPSPVRGRSNDWTGATLVLQG